MDEAVQKLFARYEALTRNALAGDLDAAEVTGIYASEFIAASPAGVMAGKNGEDLVQAMIQGFAQYRAIGTRKMQIRGLRLSSIDEHHCVAHVAWTATYVRDDLPETAIDFDVHYLVQVLDGVAKVFGWISGDEQALLKDRGIL